MTRLPRVSHERKRWVDLTADELHARLAAESRQTTASITISSHQGIRVALRLLWDSLTALWHRDTVTFYLGEDE